MDPDPVLPLIIQRLEDIGGSGSAHHQEEDQPPNASSEQAMERSSSKSSDQTDENKEDETRSEGATSATETTEKAEEDGEETNHDGVIKDFIFYLPLYRDVVRGDWESTKRVFDQDPTAITAGITSYMDTVLHLAVRSGLPIQFVKNLVALMSEEDVATLDVDKNTALHCAGIVGYTEAAKILVEKNPRMTQLRDFDNKTPLHWAAQYAHKPTVRYLLSVTRDEHPSPLTGERGAKLLNLLIIADFYDLAIHLLRRYPSLALQQDDEGFTGLHRLALKPHAFLSGSQLGYFQRLLYKCTYFKNARARPREDIENHASNIGCHLEEPRKIGHLKHIHETMLMHKQALELTKLLCAETVKYRNLMKEALFATPIVTAARMGIREIVSEIIKTFPDAVWSWDNDKRYIFHLAVVYRKEQVYNLVYQMSLQKHYVMSYTDKFWNNILHLAGKLEPSNRISGAALQMQRELQWFKEVENIVQPSYKEVKNEAGKTPREVFTEEHKELVVKGEEWMKNTASSCTVVAALVVTVVFAAAFTLPGGNNSDGTPVYLHDLSFLIFTVSNALGLFASSTSVLMFLGILTSRYSEEDFLRALPMRLCIGLITLFLSMAFMLAAFSSALHIVLVHRLKWVVGPIILLAGIPVTLFGFLQFPLLVEIVSSTFGPSIFHSQSKEIIY
ncbi:hypothetical protein K2173_024442 [Erythroxylum novogranatense]|uniref:PGG domain-containing protein n=1 Tax=Erythroxylum novogranatense TaxID=1862640 RepID=A0AAV8SUF9_9ROSI|nr:hypothetical protein K2173_024442 [Erythroxylum novogranatense]